MRYVSTPFQYVEGISIHRSLSRDPLSPSPGSSPKLAISRFLSSHRLQVNHIHRGQLTDCSCCRISLPVHSLSWNLEHVPLWLGAFRKRVNRIFGWAIYTGRDCQRGLCSDDLDSRTCRIRKFAAAPSWNDHA